MVKEQIKQQHVTVKSLNLGLKTSKSHITIKWVQQLSLFTWQLTSNIVLKSNTALLQVSLRAVHPGSWKVSLTLLNPTQNCSFMKSYLQLTQLPCQGLAELPDTT